MEEGAGEREGPETKVPAARTRRGCGRPGPAPAARAGQADGGTVRSRNRFPQSGRPETCAPERTHGCSPTRGGTHSQLPRLPAEKGHPEGSGTHRVTNFRFDLLQGAFRKHTAAAPQEAEPGGEGRHGGWLQQDRSQVLRHQRVLSSHSPGLQSRHGCVHPRIKPEGRTQPRAQAQHRRTGTSRI